MSVGGGAFGETLLRTAIEAQAVSRSARGLRWRLLAAASLPADSFDALAAAASSDLIVERARRDFAGLLRNCAVSVSQGGYNTTLDVVLAGARAVIVPFSRGGQTEQSLRASRFEALGLVSRIEESELTPKRLASAIDAAVDGPQPGPARIAVDASDYEARLEFDPASPTSTRFEFRAKAEALLADDPDLQKKWYPRLETLEILSEPFAEVSDKNRAKIRGSMLGKKQLDAERFPEISGSISKVVDAEDPDFPYLVTITLDVHGQRVQREIRGRFEQTENGVDLEAVGEFRFTDFGIKPFSAFLGAVKNRDNLHLYVRLRAR